MRIELQREQYAIKNGWGARCPALRLAAHGVSPQLADRNLEQVVRAFFAPFAREGTLVDEVAGLAVRLDDGPGELQIAFV